MTEDRAAPAPTLGLGMIDVPAAMATTVKTANQTAVDILEAIPEGSSVSFSADQLALFSTDERIGPFSEAHARVEHFARACGCSFLFRQKAGTGTFTKEKRTPKTALRAATTDCLNAPRTNILPALLTRRMRQLLVSVFDPAQREKHLSGVKIFCATISIGIRKFGCSDLQRLGSARSRCRIGPNLRAGAEFAMPSHDGSY